VDNVAFDQKFIAEQVKANGHVVAQLTLCQFNEEAHSVHGSLGSVVFEEEAPFINVFADDEGKGTLKPRSSKCPRTKCETQKRNQRR
jgi:hypothetical protein